MSFIPQGRFGYFSIAGSLYPVFRWTPQGPRNLAVGQGVGNSWGTNFAEGLQTTRITAQFICRRGGTEFLSNTFWNYWLSRNFSGGVDDTAGLTIIGSSGKKTRTYSNCKADSFTLTIVKGAIVGFTGVFLCPGIASKGDVTPTDYSSNIDSTAPLMYDAATYSGITGSVYGAEVVYSNNHKPNAPEDGTKFLQSWDAGERTCSATFTVAEHATASEPVADGGTVTIALAGAVTRVLSLTSCIVNNPDDVDVPAGQVFQNKQYLVNGSQTTPPLVVT